MRGICDLAVVGVNEVEVESRWEEGAEEKRGGLEGGLV